MCLTDGEENALAYLNFLRTGRSFLVHVATSNCAVCWLPVLNNPVGSEPLDRKRAVGQPVPGPEGPSLGLVVQHVLEIVVGLGKIGLAGADPAPH